MLCKYVQTIFIDILWDLEAVNTIGGIKKYDLRLDIQSK